MSDVAREHDATSFMVIQVALAVVLCKLSASSEVAVGFSIAGRRDPLSRCRTRWHQCWHTARRAQRAYRPTP
jgi:hypothetical protein